MRTMLRLAFAVSAMMMTLTAAAQPDNESIRSLADPDLQPFYHGVASGDPTSESVIIWTRVTPDVPGPVMVRWRIGTDEALQNIVSTGTFVTDESRDYTVKVDVEGLDPDTYYYYEFSALERNSLIGRTKTAPVGPVDQLRFAVVSCSNYPAGYFNVYEKIYEGNDVDAVLHLGDYIYEGRGSAILQPDAPRNAPPANELIVLSDYRIRHASHKLDGDLQKLHQLYPMIAVWDDHESANNSWRDGADNHTEGAEGTWVDRKAASLQAYYEWMPLRLPDESNFNRIWRKISFGDIADLYMLDTRLYDRDIQQGLPGSLNPERTLIGEEQMNWLQTNMAASSAQYQVLGQQVVLSYWVIPNYSTGEYLPLNPDQWDGYVPERERLLNFVQEAGIDNMVVLTGDVHTGWGMDIPLDISQYNPNTGAGSVGVEFVSNSVTSSSLPFAFPLGELLIPTILTWVKYVELSRKGYVILDLTPERVQGDFYIVGNIEQPTSGKLFDEAWYSNDGDNHLQRSFNRSVDGSPAAAVPPLEPRDISDTLVTSIQEVLQFDIMGIYPNPFVEDLLVELHLFEGKDVTLKLFDTKGALVADRELGSLPRGRHLLTLHNLDIPAGAYEVLLKVGDQHTARSVMKVER